ncbi:MAG TPA: hypothetical protein VG455_01780, partial [Acidimicrobiales bacterium]|nr:hypothetical protein [Acidimicrobiales bacterium]
MEDLAKAVDELEVPADGDALAAAFGLRSRLDAALAAAVATRVAAMPATWAAWRDGVLSEGQVEAIVANVSEATADTYAAHEA